MKKIAIEEHFRSKAFAEATGTIKIYNKWSQQKVSRPRASFRLDGPDNILRGFDLADIRIRDMDDAGIDIQVISHGSGLEPLDAVLGVDLAKKMNDEFSAAVKKYSNRFACFATLAPQDPDAATRELERAVKELGFVGAKINSNIKGKYLDEDKYWKIFAMAEKLDVPIYLHPNMPEGGLAKILEDYPALLGSMWGYGLDTSICAMRLICSGIFDKHPGLKIILGHMGEALSFWLWRINNRWDKEEYATNPKQKKLLKKPGQYVKDNFYATTSGCFDIAPFMCANSVLGADRILFAVDYPPESNTEGSKFIDTVPISDGDREKICHLNAERLLRL